jgi:hypothetical protein
VGEFADAGKEETSTAVPAKEAAAPAEPAKAPPAPAAEAAPAANTDASSKGASDLK